ncbi:MAG: sigma-70 family RNA polymerase sigma factor [Chloroflexi bacterium]|nr:sigma-70 family RNA polymerase sigma factor [Chloroflexota bacterium]
MNQQTLDTSPTDYELMERIRSGDEASLAVFYDRHHLVAFRVAMRVVRDRGRAEDVLQESFLSAWRKAASYKPGRGAPKSWLMGIVRNRAIDTLRSLKDPVADDEAVLAVTPADGPGVAEEVDARLEAERVRAAINALPEDQRVAVTIAFLEGRTHAEIARDLGVPLGTVHGRVRLGLRRMRAYLAAEGFDPALTADGAGFGAIMAQPSPSPQPTAV